MKEYYCDVRVSWGTSFEAENKEDFIIKLKEQFKDDYNIELTDDEIHNVQGGKEDYECKHLMNPETCISCEDEKEDYKPYTNIDNIVNDMIASGGKK